MDTSERAGPIPVRELMSHLSTDPDTSAAERSAADDDGTAPEEVRFEHEGVEWVAREAGDAAWGTDVAVASVAVAVHFYRAENPGYPEREVLVPRGRLRALFPSQLVDLLMTSTEVPPEGTTVTRPRRTRRSPRRSTGPARKGRSDRGGRDSRREGS
jgi:hypothetical protein